MHAAPKRQNQESSCSKHHIDSNMETFLPINDGGGGYSKTTVPSIKDLKVLTRQSQISIDSTPKTLMFSDTPISIQTALDGGHHTQHRKSDVHPTARRAKPRNHILGQEAAAMSLFSATCRMPEVHACRSRKSINHTWMKSGSKHLTEQSKLFK